MVSAPAPAPTSRPRTSTSGTRSTSGPAAPLAPRGISFAPKTPGIIEEEDDDDEPKARKSEGAKAHEGPVDVDRALKERPEAKHPATEVPPASGGAASWEMVEEMRRDIGNLQLDMLRMGRGIRNEIRQAMQPVVAELRESRATIEEQRREIERLRRGY